MNSKQKIYTILTSIFLLCVTSLVIFSSPVWGVLLFMGTWQDSDDLK